MQPVFDATWSPEARVAPSTTTAVLAEQLLEERSP